MTDKVLLPNTFTNYAHAMETLNYGLPKMPSDLHAGEFGLERVFALLSDLGSPQNSMKVIHLAGTSGKGTTAYMIDAGLRHMGLSVGMSVSPYVYDMKERWYVDGAFLDDEVIYTAAQEILPHLHTALSENRLTTRFETIICLAFYIMQKQRVTYFVLETGMGGLLDPTNTVEREDKISVLTSIGLDHTHILGHDIAKIAEHKAGIIRPNSTAFSYPQSQGITKAMQSVARSKSAELRLVEPLKESSVSQPRFERNAALAQAVCGEVAQRESLQLASEDELLDVFADVDIPGRNQRLQRGHSQIILDGAHNTQKLTAITDMISRIWQSEETGVVMVFSKEDQLDEMLQLLAGIAATILVVDYPDNVVDFKQALPASTVTKRAKALKISTQSVSYDAAVAQIKNSRHNWLITGSFYHLEYFSTKLR